MLCIVYNIEYNIYGNIVPKSLFVFGIASSIGGLVFDSHHGIDTSKEP